MRPPEAIFPLINDYRNWTLWSPYEHRDPGAEAHLLGCGQRDAARSMPGRATRTSAPAAWRSSTPSPNRIIIKLDFFTPFKANNIAEFTLEPKGGATDVTWAMHGPVPFIGKIMHLIIDCDKMCGKDFASRPRQHEGRRPSGPRSNAA